MQVKEAVEAYSFAVLSLSPKTQEWYSQKLRVFSEWCAEIDIQLQFLTVHNMRQFAEYLKTRTNPHTSKQISTYTQHGYMQVVKGFLNWCAQEPDLDKLVSERLVKKVPLTRVEKKVIEVFTQEQVKSLLDACKKEKIERLQVRDRAIIAVLFDTGMRASELCSLTLDNVFISTSEQSYLKIHGKGNKWREVAIGQIARAALHRYITRHRQHTNDKRVFISRYGKPLTVNGLDQLFDRLGEWAHITGVRCSPHTARHTYAVSYLANGGDVYKLSRLMGHTSVNVTENYLRAFKDKDARNGDSVLDQMK